MKCTKKYREIKEACLTLKLFLLGEGGIERQMVLIGMSWQRGISMKTLPHSAIKKKVALSQDQI